jgi:starvation-inducible DNA-binding protein
VVNTIRAVHDDVDDRDPTSADILHAVLETLEKQRWMLASQLRHVSN